MTLDDRKSARWTLLAAGFLAALPAVVLLVVPVYAGIRVGVGDGVPVKQMETTLLAVMGSSALVPTALPVLVALLPWVTRQPARRRLLVRGAATFQSLFAVAGAMTIGLLYVPSALTLWAVAYQMRSSKDAT